MRVFKKIVLIVILLVSILMVTALVLARIFEDELTEYALQEINQQLRTEIKVESINLTFIKKFPDASLEFRDVFIRSVPDYNRSDFGEMNTDTLLAANQLFLRFNVWKLIKREYLIREVQVQTGKLNVFIDRTGTGNYVFWNTRENDKEKNFLLALENVRLSGMLLRIENRALDINARGMLRRIYFKGEFSRETYSMSTGFEGKLQHYANEGAVLLQEQSISGSSSLSVDPESIRISQGSLELSGQQMLVSGTILRSGPLDLDLNVEGRQLDLDQVLQHIVLLSESYPEDLKAGGKFDFKAVIKGTVSNTRMPEIKADFNVQEGWLQTSRLPWEIRDIQTSGSYSNGRERNLKTTVLGLRDMSMRFGKSRVGGDYTVSNFISPTFNYQIKTDLELSDIKSFKQVDDFFENFEGKVLAEIRIEGNQALLKNLRKEDLLNYTYGANIHMENVTLKSGRIPFEFKDFTGDADFTDHLNVHTLSGELENSRISVSGRVDNFLEYLVTPDGNLWMDIDLYSERLDLNHLSSLRGRTNSERDTVFLPERLYLKTRFWFDDLEIKKFSANTVTGNLIYKPRRLSINRIELSSMEGRIESEGILEQRKDMSFLIKALSGINSVNITEAFTSFNNFGQDFIVDQHLKGSLTGEVNFSAFMSPLFKIKKESILADCDILIKNGALTGFEPMMSLSKYLNVEELENISFSTLSNEIFIRNEEILIPKMDINSSAVNITASGIHGFDKEFTYKLKLALSELLASKSNKPDKQESEFGAIEDDGLGKIYLYLVIEGSPNGSTVKYDPGGAVQNIREQMKEEKKELKQILNEEFGLFKKDTTLLDEQNQEDAPDFIIEWEEEEVSNQVEAEKSGNKSSEEKFTIVWDEDETAEEDSIPEGRKRRRKKKK